MLLKENASITWSDLHRDQAQPHPCSALLFPVWIFVSLSPAPGVPCWLCRLQEGVIPCLDQLHLDKQQYINKQL